MIFKQSTNTNLNLKLNENQSMQMEINSHIWKLNDYRHKKYCSRFDQINFH